jgi:hypothetical protein
MRYSEMLIGVAQYMLVKMERVGHERLERLASTQGEVVQLCWLTAIKKYHPSLFFFKFSIPSVNYLFTLIKSKNA